MIFLLIPIEDELPVQPNGVEITISTDFDFIHYFYGLPNQTHSWNHFRLIPQVAEKVAKGRV